MNKKGDLSLSVNTIVIIILAITLLGLGLTFIQTLVGGATDKIGSFIDTTDLSEKPTSGRPLVVPTTLEVKYDSSRNVNVGFYNKGPGTLQNAKLMIDKCISTTGGNVVTGVEIVAPEKTELGPSETVAYLAVLSVSGVAEGNYICTLGMDGTSITTDFYLNVIT